MITSFIDRPLFAVLIGIAVVWTLIWKGIALWQSARNRQTVWFVVMLIVNTIGILEILYLLFFRKDQNAAMVAQSEPQAPTAPAAQ